MFYYIRFPGGIEYMSLFNQKKGIKRYEREISEAVP